MAKISIVIPALNESKGIVKTLNNIPRQNIQDMGYEIEIIVIDNGSVDDTGIIAQKLGAKVVNESIKGYGSAYKTGFSNATGDIIVTCDADGTYPVKDIPRLLFVFNDYHLDFLNTNRFLHMNKGSMSFRNKIGNSILTMTMRLLYGLKIRDSQSGMWVFKRQLLDNLQLRYVDWVFSQELKIEACFYGGFKWSEVPIDYYKRVGKVRLSAWRVGLKDMFYLIKKRIKR